MQKYSITKGLSELKLLDARIKKAINPNLDFAIGVRNNTKINGTYNIDEATQIIESNFQSVNDLILRRALIKAKIVQSNAVTIVEIGDKKMTVAEAIEYKTSIQYNVLFLKKLKSDFNSASATVIRGNEEAVSQAQKSVDTILGKEAAKTASKEEIDAIFNGTKERHSYTLVDPLKIAEVIEKLEAENEDFLNNVDFQLSTSNATTMIDVA